MQFENNKPLDSLNTFRFPSRAEHFISVGSIDELCEAAAYARGKAWPVFILGGGSNLVLTGDIAGLVIQQHGRAIQCDTTADPKVSRITVEAGRNWHDLVQTLLQAGLHGLENLALIPGSAGAAPVQNIGAYGVELADFVERVDALDMVTGERRQFDRSECNFGYRDSIFKQNRNRYAIHNLTLQLHQDNPPASHYQSLNSALQQAGIDNPAPQDIFNTVCDIRRQRLPDPALIGNAGSFFKNPLVSRERYAQLQLEFPLIIGYPQDGGHYKLAAGWLIETAGFKGFQRGNVGVHAKQALVLTHRGGSDGRALMQLAAEIRQSIKQLFGLQLEIEPVVI